MSGPPKTPPRLHLIRGNPSKRPVKDSKKTAKKDEKGLPKIPQHLGAQGKYWFRRMAEELNAEGIISQLDARALELLVEAYTEYRHHCEILDVEGYTYRTETQNGDVLIKAHPAAAMKADAWKRISSDANNLDGLNIHCAIIDELHAHKTRDVWDVLETATGARLQSLLFGITTAGFNKEGICYEQRDYAIKVLRGYNSDVEGAVKDDSYFAIIYTLDEGDDPFDETVWQKANPGLGICKRWDDLRRLAKKAKEQVSARVNFFTKHMNVWVTAESAWMDMIKWEKCEYIAPQHELKTYPMWVGVDLAHKIDICAAAKLWRTDNGHVHADFKFWLPEGRLERCSRQQAELYRKWAEMDKLILTDGDVIDHAQIKSDLLEWIGGENLRELGFDPWSAMQFSLALAEEGIPLVEVPQTVRNLSEAMKETESLVYAGRFHHSNHPVMNWMMSNVTVKPDKNDNIFPNKSTPEAKIDGPVALFTAMSRFLVNGGGVNDFLSTLDPDEDLLIL
ncbi:phage terminase small subunit P27 family [Escherichia coli]|uniref:phage terminase small subunit P27 family n=6 Tax=Escherichia coli TaxID=562 RepID=UPI00254ED545|nr:phage terminase small subunit P27 family [Escherichia coli]